MSVPPDASCVRVFYDSNQVRIHVAACPQGIDSKAEQLIADLMGGLYAPFMLGGLKFGSWVKRLLLRQSSISQAVDTLHNIAKVGL
jgi:hypothetical protein